VIGRLRRHRHLALLALLIGALVTQPLVAREAAAARLTYDLIAAAGALAVLLVVFEQRWERQVALAFALPAIVLTIARYVVPADWLAVAIIAYCVSVALFLGFAVCVIVREIFAQRAVGVDDILGAFAGYVLLGIAWGGLYAAVEAATPGSFSVAADIRWQLDDWHLRRALFSYVSFATMASLGYADVVPVTPLANTLTWIEVMLAQFYLAVVVAQIVGLKIGEAIDRKGAPPT
jgi:voltage-gated potassium channel